MTLMRMREVVINVIAWNRAAVGTPNVVISQMNFKGQSPMLRGILAVFSPEIGSPIISVERLDIDTIEVLDLDRLISLVLSLSSDRVITILRSPGS